MNPVTGAVPPLIRGHGIRFEVDRWTWRRLDAARFDGERRHLLATRGRPWHADPRRGGDTDALETWHLLAGRHQGGGMGLTVTGPGGKLDVCFASMFVRQVRQCFSVVWADGFPRCRHRFPVM